MHGKFSAIFSIHIFQNVHSTNSIRKLSSKSEWRMQITKQWSALVVFALDDWIVVATWLATVYHYNANAVWSKR